jgi:hypothetical protein
MVRLRVMRDWIDKVLEKVCVDNGYCLQGESAAAVYRVKPLTVDAVTDAIISGEGLDPSRCGHRELLRAVVAEYFEVPVPEVIRGELDSILDELYDARFRVTNATHDSQAFGDIVVDFAIAGTEVRLVRDRGQFMLAADPDKLRVLGLHRVLEKAEIVSALTAFAAAHR